MLSSYQKKWVVWYAICLHYLWGILLLGAPSVANITAIHSVSIWIPWRWLEGVTMLVVASMALWSMVINHAPSMKNLILVMPQQILLVMSAGGAIQAVARQSFADGVTRPWAFILADQAPALLVAVLHTVAILEFHSDVGDRIVGLWNRMRSRWRR